MTDWAEPAANGTSFERRAMLAEIAERYYVNGESQSDIGEAFNISRSNVSRLLDTARKAKIVQFVIAHPLRRHKALERQLQERFGVAEVVVAAESDTDLQLIGTYGARWIAARSGRLAIGWGRSVQAAIDNVVVDEPRQIEIVQIGGDLTVPPAASGHELTRRLATALGGTYEFLHAPALVESERVATELLADPRIAAQLERARSADAALIGIGVGGESFWTGVIDEAMGPDQVPVADVAVRLLDGDGKEIDSPLARRVVALDVDDLRHIPEVAALAAGAAKGPPIAAALKAGVVDVLICDQPAAAAALIDE